MRNVATLTLREIRAVFLAPASFIILGLFLGLTGYFFRFVLTWVDGDISLCYRTFAASVYFHLFLGVLPPLLTMRSVAAERSSGTFELLMTAPVSDFQVAVSKFLGAYIFYVALWAPTLLYPIALYQFGGSPDFGQVTAFTIGILALGALLIAAGVFCSSLTSNVLTAFFCSFVLNVVLLFAMNGLSWLAQSRWAREWLQSMNVTAHLDDFSRGILDVRHLVFYATGSALFLFLAVRGLESRKWR